MAFAAALIPAIPMAINAIAKLINETVGGNNNANGNDRRSDEYKELREQMAKKDNANREKNQALLEQNQQRLNEMSLRHKEQRDANDALAAQNKQLSDLMKKNEEDQRARNAELAEQNKRLDKQIEKYQKEHKEQLIEMNKLLADLKDRKLDSFEALEKNDKKAKEALINLAQQAKPIGMEGNNIAIFGLTSSGKSTMLNSLLGEKVAATGMGETTLEVASYAGKGFVLWDIPGRNDEVSYMSMQYISFFKGLTRRLILLEHTIKQNSSMMKLLDAIGLDYDIVINKMDIVDKDERAEYCEQIRKEIEKLQLKRVGRLFFVSAKYPQQFDDWVQMVNYLTNPPKK